MTPDLNEPGERLEQELRDEPVLQPQTRNQLLHRMNALRSIAKEATDRFREQESELARLRARVAELESREPAAIYEGLGNVSVGMTNLVKGDHLYLGPQRISEEQAREAFYGMFDVKIVAKSPTGLSRDDEARMIGFMAALRHVNVIPGASA